MLVRRRFYKGNFGAPKCHATAAATSAQPRRRSGSGNLKAGHGEGALVFTTRTGRMINAHNLRTRFNPALATGRTPVIVAENSGGRD